jgi:hypothetical protein
MSIAQSARKGDLVGKVAMLVSKVSRSAKECSIPDRLLGQAFGFTHSILQPLGRVPELNQTLHSLEQQGLEHPYDY